MLARLNTIISRFRGASAQFDEPLVQLIATARDDAEIRKRLIMVLEQDAFQRHSSLNTWIRELQLHEAPEPFVRAIRFLLVEETADAALDLLHQAD